MVVYLGYVGEKTSVGAAMKKYNCLARIKAEREREREREREGGREGEREIHIHNVSPTR